MCTPVEKGQRGDLRPQVSAELGKKRAVIEGVNELEIGDIPLLSKEGKGVVIKDAKQPHR
jgi:hypothetical protein